MNSAESILTVQPPFPRKQLGRYRQQDGVFLIRLHGKVLYIGQSKNICNAINRLFYKDGALEHISFEACVFEVIQSTLNKSTIEQALKSKLKPAHNYLKKGQQKYRSYRHHQAQRVLKAYQQQSRFEQLGQHQTDLNS